MRVPTMLRGSPNPGLLVLALASFFLNGRAGVDDSHGLVIKTVADSDNGAGGYGLKGGELPAGTISGDRRFRENTGPPVPRRTGLASGVEHADTRSLHEDGDLRADVHTLGQSLRRSAL